MNKKLLLILTMVILPFHNLFANSGVFYSGASQLYPIKETTISIQKEILTITYNQQGDDFYWDVTVHFVFHNPGPPKKALVGFVTPGPYSPEGDLQREKSPERFIKNFTVTMDGITVPYQTKITSNPEYDSKIIFTFNALFKNGESVIDHSYRTKGHVMGGDIGGIVDLKYTLKTGSYWAGPIKDFTLIIKSNTATAFNYIPLNEIKGASGEIGQCILDRAKIPAANPAIIADCLIPAYVLKGGSITINKKNFLPNDDITISVYSEWHRIAISNTAAVRNEIAKLFPSMTKLPFCTLRYDSPLLMGVYEHTDDSQINETQLLRYSADELLFFRYALLSLHGYPDFTKKWKDFFQKSVYYIPDPKFRFGNIPKRMRKRIEQLKKIEMQKRAGKN